MPFKPKLWSLFEWHSRCWMKWWRRDTMNGYDDEGGLWWLEWSISEELQWRRGEWWRGLMVKMGRVKKERGIWLSIGFRPEETLVLRAPMIPFKTVRDYWFHVSYSGISWSYCLASDHLVHLMVFLGQNDPNKRPKAWVRWKSISRFLSMQLPTLYIVNESRCVSDSFISRVSRQVVLRSRQIISYSHSGYPDCSYEIDDALYGKCTHNNTSFRRQCVPFSSEGKSWMSSGYYKYTISRPEVHSRRWLATIPVFNTAQILIGLHYRVL